MSLFGPPNIEKMKDKRNIKGLIKALGYRKEQQVRRDACIALGQLGDEKAVGPLIAYFENEKDLFSRTDAVNSLGKIGNPEAVDWLMASLKEKNRTVRIAIIDALGTSGSRKAVEPLIKILKYERGVITNKGEAAKALGMIGDIRAIDPLVEALANSTGYQEASTALVQFGHLAVQPLVTALGHKNERVRFLAARVLGKIGDNRAVRPLVWTLRDKSLIVRKDAAQALDKLGWLPGRDIEGARYWIAIEEFEKCIEIGAQAIKPLRAFLKDFRGDARNRAAEALAMMGDTGSVDSLIEMLSSKDLAQVKAAAESLLSLGWKPNQSEAGAWFWIIQGEWDKCVSTGPSALKPLLTVLADRLDSNLQLRLGAVGALGKMNDSEAMTALINALGSDEHKDVTRKARRVLRQLFTEGVVDPLTGALESAKKELRKPVINMVARSGPRAVESLVSILKSKDRDTRDATIKALEWLKWKPDQGKIGAWYWIVNRKWEKCIAMGAPAADALLESIGASPSVYGTQAMEALIQIGDPAVGPLIEAFQFNLAVFSKELRVGAWSISDHTKEVRWYLAKTVAGLYRSGKLGAESKQLILTQRSDIEKTRISKRTGHHDQRLGCFDHDDIVSHMDEAISL